MGFSEKDALKLKPVNPAKPGSKRKRGRKHGLVAPTGIADWEAHETALTFTDLLAQQAGQDGTGRRELLATGWNLLEACGLVPYERGESNRTEQAPVYHLPVRGQ